MSKVVKKKLVEVIWVDPETDGGWHEDDHDGPMPRLYTYGLLVRKTKDRLTIASGWDPARGNWSDLMRFPIGTVVKINVIKTVEYTL